MVHIKDEISRMVDQDEILKTIKTLVREEIPESKVYLFGSRARGDWHSESDWDILVLTKNKYPKAMKWKIHDKLFPLSVEAGTIFQFIVATQDEWENNPAYYTFQNSIKNELMSL